MNRIRITWAIALLVLAVSLPIACNQNGKSGKNIGIQLYSLRDSMAVNPAKTVAEVGQIGYSFVELAGYSDGKFYGMNPVDFKALVESNGMTIESSHTGMPVPDSTRWDSVMAWWDVCIAAHAELGVKFIVQPFMDSVGYQTLAGLQRYCDYFNAVGEKCKARGIRFGYHNHSEEFKQLEGQVIYDYMLTHTDTANVVFEIDLYWAVEGGADPVAYFSNYPGRFPLWHVKDEKEVGASGKMDFKTIFEHAAVSGMVLPIVEQEEYTTTPLEGVKQSYEFLYQAEYVK